MFSYFSDKSLYKQELPSDYLSYEEWSNIRKMRVVLLEISKTYPQTRLSYDKFINKEIGYVDNLLNKHNIIYNYIKTEKLNKYNINKIQELIDNYKLNAEIIDMQYLSTYNLDKKILIHILSNYLDKVSNYKLLLEIIRLLEQNKMYPEPYEINKLLESCSNNQLRNDIKYYRSFSYLI